MMAEAATTFPRFGDLPLELREAIWRECLPHRIVELDTPQARRALKAVHDDEVLPICDMSHTTKANSVPPLISRVCHEARAVTFEQGQLLSDPGNDHETSMLFTSLSGQWFDPARDIVYLNFTIHYDNPQGGIDAVRGFPMPYFLKLAGHAAGVSIDEPLIHYNPTLTYRWQVRDHLETLRECFVCVTVVCLHVDLQPALDSCLFAEDNRIVMIDAFDYDKIAEFRRLWETHGSRQDFRTAEFFDGYVDDGSFMIQGMTVKQLQYCFKRLWLLERWHEVDWTQYPVDSQMAMWKFGEEGEERPRQPSRISPRSPLGRGCTIAQAGFTSDHYDAAVYSGMLRGFICHAAPQLY